MTKRVWTLLFFLISGSAIFAQQKDSTIAIVWKALTADETHLTSPVMDHLVEFDWEALAYWDSKGPKTMDQMFEAVGDIYRFNKDSTFLLKMVDPSNPKNYGLEIGGTFQLAESTIELTSEKGKKLNWQLIFLDENYMILEIDALRIFYTKSISYYTID